MQGIKVMDSNQEFGKVEGIPIQNRQWVLIGNETENYSRALRDVLAFLI